MLVVEKRCKFIQTSVAARLSKATYFFSQLDTKKYRNGEGAHTCKEKRVGVTKWGDKSPSAERTGAKCLVNVLVILHLPSISSAMLSIFARSGVYCKDNRHLDVLAGFVSGQPTERIKRISVGQSGEQSGTLVLSMSVVKLTGIQQAAMAEVQLVKRVDKSCSKGESSSSKDLTV